MLEEDDRESCNLKMRKGAKVEQEDKIKDASFTCNK